LEDGAPENGAPSGYRPLRPTASTALKIAVVGPLGVGKTTLVGSVSEISPLTTEETMTKDADGVDPDSGARRFPASKSTTTVAMDFGRISLDEQLVLYLFGTPGQERFWFLWDGLVDGALGAVVLVDVRRLEESFDVLERLERRGCAFIVAANAFPDAPVYPSEVLREALDLPSTVPVLNFDARERSHCRDVLIALAGYLLTLTSAARADPAQEQGSDQESAQGQQLPHQQGQPGVLSAGGGVRRARAR
jgi:signal recognition particle receptor subunit beta